jgi:hypothetical protein
MLRIPGHVTLSELGMALYQPLYGGIIPSFLP